MKIKQKHYNILKDIVTKSPVFNMYEEYMNSGMSEMRWRWDCVWSSKSGLRNDLFNEMYKYADDDHIDTALRRITK